MRLGARAIGAASHHELERGAASDGTWRRLCSGRRPRRRADRCADRFHAAVASAGPGLADILWRVVCAGERMRDAETALGWPARAGKLVLTLAPDRVADFYRIR